MAEEKFIRLTFSDGTMWDIPAAFIAKQWAAHYTQVDLGEEPTGPELSNYVRHRDTLFNEVLEDEFELLDWLSNNMNWDDVAGVAQFAGQLNKTVDYQQEFLDAERYVYSKEVA